MVKAYVVNGLGVGCHQEVAHAYEKARAKAEIIHIKQLLKGEKDLFDSQILNLSGGFLHGDMMGAGMCAANEIEHATLSNDEERKFKDVLLEFVEKGNIVYGQCNGFQVLVKTGLLPGIANNHSKQTVTLTDNNCGVYRVTPAMHVVENDHFAFEGLDDDFYLWCRHGEGKIVFYSDHSLVKEKRGEVHRKIINERHVLLRYVDPDTKKTTEEFPHNPNGSVDGIAGLANNNGRVFGHMAHPEVSVYLSRDPRYFRLKDKWRRGGFSSVHFDKKKLEGIGLKIFKNIVMYFE
jgi:phosphoribosylformylglycinamidine synthase